MPDVEMVDIDDNCNKSPNSEINQQKNKNTTKPTDNRVTVNDTEMESDKDQNDFTRFFANERVEDLTRLFEQRRSTTPADKFIKDNQPDEPMEEDNSRSEATFSFKITDVTNFFNSKDNRLSDACYVRNLPWKIMAMPRFTSDRQTRSLGFFLQCNGESESLTWSCNASAELKLLSQVTGIQDMTRSIDHHFFPKENDWGFTQFISYNDIMDPAKGFCKDDTIILEVSVKADVPHGIQWDSKKYTGYVGVKNQGATCYMNSLLQTLFFTNKLRKAVYLMPTESDDSSKSVALALQRVFYELQFSDKPVGTKKLTKSFGWETLDSFMQHDVQELCRVLLDNIESKMKNTCVAGTIPKLFEGKMISFIRCKHVDFHSTRTEPFYDIQLNIKGKQNIYDSFDEYISVETLNGENKYDAGDYGLQEAEKGIIFESFPPVLHLHLLRFQYDPLTDNNVKINDRFEFFEEINLSKYLKSNNDIEDSYRQPYSFVSEYQNSSGTNNNNNNNNKQTESAIYILHAVLVHSGDNHGGHYVVFINPKGDGNWCKFDDDVVSVCSKNEAISNNFGGTDDETSKHCTNAYMLVYIRQDSDVLEPVTEESIPSELVERLKEEKRQETLRRKERTEQHLFLTITAYTECSFMGHRGNDLFDLDKAICKTFKVERSFNYQQTLASIGAELNYPPEGIRLWQIIRRDNDTYRPSALEMTDDKDRSIEDILERSSNVNSIFSCFLELVRPSAPVKCLPDYYPNAGNILLFFKYYDPINEFITYCGYDYINENSKFTSLVPILNAKVGLRANTPLILYEEVRPDCCNLVDDQNKSLKEVLEDLMSGDIICFQKDDISTYSKSVKLPTVVDYFRDLNNRIEVVLCDKNIPNDTGFVLELSKDMNYDELSKAVAQRLNTEPDLIQFYKIQSSYRTEPSQPIKCNFDGTLKELFPAQKPRLARKLFYQLLTIKINELEFKKQFKCVWVNSKLKEERELLLYPNKSGTVADLLEEAKKHLCENVYGTPTLSPDGSGRLRLLEITSNRIIQISKEDVLVECLNTTTSKSYRVEEIPKDEIDLEANEFLMPVAHFHKEPILTFGTPFLLKIRQKELLSQIKSRIQKKLDVSDKEFEKYKFALVCGSRAQYFNETVDYPVSKEEFQMHVTSNVQAMQNRPWLGLEHMNKAPKRSRYNYLEKAIKIHN